MAKKKSHKFLVVWLSILVVILLVFTSFFLFARPEQQTSYFHSGELGVVETKITIYSWYNKWMRPVEQAIFFAQEAAGLDETVYLRDDITYMLTSSRPYTHDCILEDVELYVITPTQGDIYIGGWVPSSVVIDRWTHYGQAYTDMSLTVRYSFTPTETGTYSGRSDYTSKECEVVNLDLVNCLSAQPGCSMFSETSDNFVTVSAEEECGKEPYWDIWVFDPDTGYIDNGEVIFRVYMGVNPMPVCDWYEQKTQYETICDEGYQITGETVRIKTADAPLTCELADGGTGDPCLSDVDCEGQICISLFCAAYKCLTTNDNIEITCDDGTVIVKQQCINFRLIGTGNGCPDVPECSTGMTTCVGSNYTLCVDGFWVGEGLVDGKCGYNATVVIPDCSTGMTTCVGSNYTVCENQKWVDEGLVDGKCDYNGTIDTTRCTTGDTDCDGYNYLVCENEKWVNKGTIERECDYTVTRTPDDPNKFDIIWWMLGAVGVLFVVLIIYIFLKKRKNK